MRVNGQLVGKRILVVEDEYLLAADLKGMLGSLGAEVVGPFGRLKPALAAAEKEQVDGAILDVRLDGEHVYALADRLIELGVPLLLATGYEADQIPSHLRHLPCLRKPYTQEQVSHSAYGAFFA